MPTRAHTPAPTSAEKVRRALEAEATPGRAEAVAGYFKTGKGEYGEGDRFLGVTVPAQRAIAKAHAGLALDEALELLRSPVHEERLTALLILVRQFEKGDEALRGRIVEAYLANTSQVNNWDLVDSSAPYLLGTWLLERDRRVLRRLARSESLWERRIAMLSTLAFIRRGEDEDALAIATLLLDDEHDLIHKAVGWMLREVGGRVGLEPLRRFLDAHAARMPRTMLRYAIEKLPKAERQAWLARR